MLILQTDRLILRHFEPEDLEPLAALYADPDMRRFYPEGTLTREQTARELNWFMHGPREHPELGLWATVDRQTGEFIGRCGLLPWVLDGHTEVEVAFMIDKRRWREGLGTEAARGIVRYAQETLGLSRLICLAVPSNEASLGVARKIGMRFERTFVDALGTSEVYALGARAGST